MQDDDVKVFIPGVTPIQKAGAPGRAVAELSDELCCEEDIAQAKALGRQLAHTSSYGEKLAELTAKHHVHVGGETALHVNTLMTFSAEQAIQKVLQPRVLADAAIAALHSELLQIDLRFWETIADGTAYTKYYLVTRGAKTGTPVADEIGAAFALLCGDPQNEDLRRLGHDIFAEAPAFILSQF